MGNLEEDIRSAFWQNAGNMNPTLDRLANRVGELTEERDAFGHDLTYLREELMERVGGYTPADADLVEYVDRLRSQVESVRALATEWAAMAPEDDWGEGGIGETILADAGRLILAKLEGE